MYISIRPFSEQPLSPLWFKKQGFCYKYELPSSSGFNIYAHDMLTFYEL